MDVIFANPESYHKQVPGRKPVLFCMKSIYNFLSLLIGLTLFLSLSLQGQTLGEVDRERLDAFFTHLVENNRFMGSVVVMDGNEVVFSEAYGFIDSDRTPAEPSTIYRIGSISKTYTAAMILQLIEQGELGRTTTLDRFYPMIPNAESITIEHLLRHQSGLVNFTNEPEYMYFYTSQESRENLIERFVEYGTNFDPGERSEYSNTGYVLLGYIIEDVTGMHYSEALQEMINESLGFTSTRFGSEIRTNQGEAVSFNYTGQWEEAPQTYMDIPHGAGAVTATAGETARFFRALILGELLSEESLIEMARIENGYGMGLIELTFQNTFGFGHTGGIDGFQSMAGHFPDDDLTFSILGNALNYSINEITTGLLRISYDMDFDFPEFEEGSVELAEEDLNKYTGRFTSGQLPMNIHIFRQNGILMAQATGQSAFPLSATSETVLRFDQAGIIMEFGELQGGEYQVFLLQQAGVEYRFSRE